MTDIRALAERMRDEAYAANMIASSLGLAKAIAAYDAAVLLP